MSMELISKQAVLELIEHSNIYSVNLMQNIVSDMPKVEAIPLERVEQIREHFEAIAHFNGTVKADYVLRMLDKAIKEQTGG